MNDIDELKQFVVAHARPRASPRPATGRLRRIRSDEEATTARGGGMVRSASNSTAGDHLEAARCFNMARFRT